MSGPDCRPRRWVFATRHPRRSVCSTCAMLPPDTCLSDARYCAPELGAVTTTGGAVAHGRRGRRRCRTPLNRCRGDSTMVPPDLPVPQWLCGSHPWKDNASVTPVKTMTLFVVCRRWAQRQRRREWPRCGTMCCSLTTTCQPLQAACLDSSGSGGCATAIAQASARGCTRRRPGRHSDGETDAL